MIQKIMSAYDHTIELENFYVVMQQFFDFKTLIKIKLNSCQ